MREQSYHDRSCEPALDGVGGLSARFELLGCPYQAERSRRLSGAAIMPEALSALSGRELEVLALVAVGRSNPEIAAELFISRKAVEYHLGNIYAKCVLQGRQELRRFVEQWRQPAAV